MSFSAISSNSVRQTQSILIAVRQDFKEHGKRFSAANCLSEDSKAAVKNFISTDPVAERFRKLFTLKLKHSETSEKTILYLLERFEEFCRRTGTILSQDNKTAAYRILTAKLFQAARVFDKPAKKVCGSVLLNDDIHNILNEKEFSCFREQKWIAIRSVLYYTQDPRKNLRKIKHTVDEILSEPNFKIFKQKPWIVRQVVALHPLNPRQVLSDLTKTALQIMKEAEFAYLKKTPWIIWQAVASNKDPREFLRIFRKSVIKIVNKPELIFFHDKQWIIKYALISRGNNAEKFLKNLQQTFERIMADKRYVTLHCYPSKILKVLVYNSGKPDEALQKSPKTRHLLKISA